MKKLKFQLPAAFLVFLSFAAHAQSPADTTSFNREFGFGTNIILSEIFRTDGAPFDFAYRWKSGSGHYNRIGGSLSLGGTHGEIQGFGKSQNNFSANVFYGKEWREDLANRWMLNYGADVSAGFSAFSTKNISMSDGQVDRVMEYSDMRYELGFKPFIGIIFKISERFYLNTEASLRAGAGRMINNRESYDVFDGDRGDNLDSGKTSAWTYNLHSIAAGNIFVYYRF